MTHEAKPPADVFISYKSEDRERVIEIWRELEANGVSTWIDFEDIRGGQYFAEVIVPAICNSKVVLLMATQKAVDSREVAAEVEKAHRCEKPIIPLRLEDYKLPDLLQLHGEMLQYIDLVGIKKESWLPRLLADLEMRGVCSQPPGGKRIVGALRHVLADCFKGRVDELKRLREKLENPTMRLVLVSGPQDIGKTALITSLVKTDPAPGTAIYVSMRESPVLDSLVTLLSEALPPERSAQWREKWKDQSPLGEKFEFLFGRLALEPLWIVLDDLEKVLGGAIASELMACIVACLSSEQPVRIIGLANEDPKFSPQFEAEYRMRLARVRIDKGLDRASGIALLRALEGDEDLGIGGASDDFLGSLVDRCSGYPGLLKMLIGYLISERSETLQQVVEGEAFEDFLDHPALTVYEYLTAAEREVVRAFAVFDAPTSKEAIAHLVKRPLTAELDILDRRYVLYGRSPSLQLYPLYQRFAYEQIALQDRPALHSIAADWFGTQCKKPEEIETLADVEPFVRRCRHLMRAGRAADAEELLYSVEEVMSQRGFAAQVATIHIELRSLLTDVERRGRNLRCEGLAWSELGEYPKALDCYEQSLAIGEEIGDEEMQLKALINIGWTNNELSEYEQAQKHLARAEKMITDNNSMIRGFLLGNLGDAALNLGRIDETIELTRKALQLHDGYLAGKAVWLGNLGVAHQCRGDLSDALLYFQQALAIEEQKMFRQRARTEYCRLGRAYLEARQDLKAQQHYEKANELASAIGDKTVQSRALLGLGTVWHVRSDFATARANYEAALAVGVAKTAYRCRNRLGLLSLQEQKTDEAFRHFDAAVKLSKGSSFDARYNRALAILGRNGEASAEYRCALEQCRAKGVVSAALADVRLMQETADSDGIQAAVTLLEAAL